MTIDTSTKLQTKTVAYTLTQNNKGLPDGWRWLKLGDAAKFIDYRGKTPKKTNSGIPLITAKNVKMGFINEEPREFIAEKDYKSWMTRGFPKVGDVLFTTEAPLGNVAQLKTNDRIALAQRMITFQSYEFLNSTFLKYNLQSPQFQKLLNSKGTGTTVKGIKASVLKQLEIPLPSITEQHSIVSKIEELLSELDKGKQQLETAQQQLKIYRQAVLKWAFEGKLTGGNENWTTVRLGDLANAIDPQPSHRTPPKVEGGIPFVSIKDFDSELDKIDFSKARLVSSNVLKEHKARYQLQKGDFVIGKIGTIGKPVRVVLPQDYTLSANIVLIQPRKINSTFLYYFFQSSIIEKEFLAGTRATTQAAFGIQKVREMKIQLPSDSEQNKIIQEIESRLSVCDKVEETITTSLAQAETLRQSILKKAFEGKLI
jgi:type I restriction enzyme, S subunit